MGNFVFFVFISLLGLECLTYAFYCKGHNQATLNIKFLPDENTLMSTQKTFVVGLHIGIPETESLLVFPDGKLL
jgi:hypothetical protein